MLTAIYDLDSNIDLGAYPYPLHGKGHMKYLSIVINYEINKNKKKIMFFLPKRNTL